MTEEGEQAGGGGTCQQEAAQPGLTRLSTSLPNEDRTPMNGHCAMLFCRIFYSRFYRQPHYGLIPQKFVLCLSSIFVTISVEMMYMDTIVQKIGL